MRSHPMVLTLSILTVLLALFAGGYVASAADPTKENQGPIQPPSSKPTPSSLSVEDPMLNYEKRIGALEEWKAKIEKLPSLSGKFNVGMNALQILYTHLDAKSAEGKSSDNISIRRSELLFYGKINEYVPKWHALSEFQSIGLANNTPGCAAGSPCNTQPTGSAASTTFFRESYIDFRPMPSIAPYLNFIRMGIFR